jgi:predicted  nucleic acid-binding Zn-ribbon protein
MKTDLDTVINSAAKLAGMFAVFGEMSTALIVMRNMQKKFDGLEKALDTQETKKKVLETDVTDLIRQKNDLDGTITKVIKAAEVKAETLLENVQTEGRNKKTIEDIKLKDLKATIVLESNKHTILMKEFAEKEANISQNITNLEKKMLNILNKFSV